MRDFSTAENIYLAFVQGASAAELEPHVRNLSDEECRMLLRILANACNTRRPECFGTHEK